MENCDKAKKRMCTSPPVVKLFAWTFFLSILNPPPPPPTYFSTNPTLSVIAAAHAVTYERVWRPGRLLTYLERHSSIKRLLK